MNWRQQTQGRGWTDRHRCRTVKPVSRTRRHSLRRRVVQATKMKVHNAADLHSRSRPVSQPPRLHSCAELAVSSHQQAAAVHAAGQSATPLDPAISSRSYLISRPSQKTEAAVSKRRSETRLLLVSKSLESPTTHGQSSKLTCNLTSLTFYGSVKAQDALRIRHAEWPTFSSRLSVCPTAACRSAWRWRTKEKGNPPKRRLRKTNCLRHRKSAEKKPKKSKGARAEGCRRHS
jgi:hypothetical protein